MYNLSFIRHKVDETDYGECVCPQGSTFSIKDISKFKRTMIYENVSSRANAFASVQI